MDSDLISRLAASKRILVLGSSGSGKTTFSLRLSRILCIDAVHLDAIFWKPGWISTPQPEWRVIVSSLIRRESWIMDGTYESTLDLRIPVSETVIVVERSRWSCLWRVLKRKATVDDRRRPDAPPGQKLDHAFLRYIWQYPAVTQPIVMDSIRQYGSDKPLILLRGLNDIEMLMRQLRRTVDQQAC